MIKNPPFFEHPLFVTNYPEGRWVVCEKLGGGRHRCLSFHGTQIDATREMLRTLRSRSYSDA